MRIGIFGLVVSVLLFIVCFIWISRDPSALSIGSSLVLITIFNHAFGFKNGQVTEYYRDKSEE